MSECYSGLTDLVAITADCDEQVEGRASRERRVVLPLFNAPAAVLEGIGNHITRVPVIPWVKVESNVCVGPGATL